MVTRPLYPSILDDSTSTYLKEPESHWHAGGTLASILVALDQEPR